MALSLAHSAADHPQWRVKGDFAITTATAIPHGLVLEMGWAVVFGLGREGLPTDRTSTFPDHLDLVGALSGDHSPDLAHSSGSSCFTSLQESGTVEAG